MRKLPHTIFSLGGKMSIKILDLKGSIDLNNKLFRQAIRETISDLRDTDKALAATEKEYNALGQTAEKIAEQIVVAETKAAAKSDQIRKEQATKAAALQKELAKLNAKDTTISGRISNLQTKLTPSAFQSEFDAYQEKQRKAMQDILDKAIAGGRGPDSLNVVEQKQFNRALTRVSYTIEEFADAKIKAVQRKIETAIGEQTANLEKGVEISTALAELKHSADSAVNIIKHDLDKQRRKLEDDYFHVTLTKEPDKLNQISSLEAKRNALLSSKSTNELDLRRNEIELQNLRRLETLLKEEAKQDAHNLSIHEKELRNIENINREIAEAGKILAKVNDGMLREERKMAQIADKASDAIIRDVENRKVKRDSAIMESGANATAGFFALNGIIGGGKEGATDRRALIAELNNTSIALKDQSQYIDLINKTATETGKPVRDLAISFREVENVLGSGAEGVNTWKEAVKGAIGTNSQLDSTAKSLAGTMHLFPDEFQNASEAMNMLSLAARRSPLEFTDFASVMGQTFGITKSVGLTATETAAALSLFSEEQLRSAEAGTQLRNVVQKLVQPTKQVREQLKLIKDKTGVDLPSAFSRESVRLNGFAASIGKIVEAANKLDKRPGDLAAELFPNLRGTVGGVTITDKLAEYVDLIDDLNKAKKDSVYIEQAYAAILDTTATKYDRTTELTKQLSQELSISLYPTLEKGVNFLTTFNKVLAGTPSAVKDGATNLLVYGTTAFTVANAIKFLVSVASKAHPVVGAVTLAVSLGAAAWGAYAGNQKDAENAQIAWATTVRDATKKEYNRQDSIAGLIAKLSDLTKQHKLSKEQEIEKLKLSALIADATGIEISATDDVITIQKKLAKALEDTNKKKKEQITLFARDARAEDNAKLNAQMQEMEKHRQALADAEASRDREIRKLSSSGVADPFSSETVKGLDETIKRERAAYENHKQIFNKMFRDMRIHAEELAAMERGEIAFVNKPQLPSPNSPFSFDTEAEKAKKAKDLIRQIESDINSAYREYAGIQEKIFLMKHPEIGENEAKAKFQQLIAKDAFTRGQKSEFTSVSAAVDFLKKLREANVTEGKELDTIIADGEKTKKQQAEIEKIEDHRRSLLASLSNMRNEFDAELQSSDGNKTLSRVEKMQAWLTTQSADFGANSAFMNGVLKVYYDAAMLAARLADQRQEIADQQKRGWKELTDSLEQSFGRYRDILAKFSDMTDEPTNREVILRDLTNGVFKTFAEIKDQGVLEWLSALTDKVIEFKKVSEEKKQRDSFFRDLATDITRAEGKLQEFSANTFVSFIMRRGLSPADVAKNDFLGIGTAMLNRLKFLEDSLDHVEQTYRRLKALQKKETGMTGIDDIDRMIQELDKAERISRITDGVERGFRDSVAEGIKGGIKVGIRRAVRTLESELIGLASKQIATILFDQTKKTGIIDKLFGSASLSESTTRAINNPESFASAIASKILNVRVVSGAQDGGVSSPWSNDGYSWNPFPQMSSKPGAVKPYQEERRDKRIESLMRGLEIYNAANVIRQGGKAELSSKVGAASSLFKEVGLKSIAKELSRGSMYLMANEILGDPVGRAGKWIGKQLFGSKGKSSNSGNGVNVYVNMPNTVISSPADAGAAGAEFGRVLRTDPALR